jgi:hypothetical protein
MAWEWSHTVEGIDNVHSNLQDLDRKTLEVIWSEWEAWDGNTSSTSGFDEDKYKVAMEKAKTLPEDILADEIWEKASNYRTCENGGFEAWLCPFGCGCHMASFEYEGDS